MFGFLNRFEGLAVRHQAGDLSYGEFNLLVELVGDHLTSQGLEAGDRVAVVLPNSLELLVAYYACLMKGLVIVPINERLTNPEVSKVLGDCRPRALVTTPRCEGRFSAGMTSAPLSVSTLVGIHRWVGAGSEARASPVAEGGSSNLGGPPWPMDHPAILFYTSGSTGAPKGALYTHGTLIDNERIFSKGLEVTSADHSVLCHCMASNFIFAQVTVPFLNVGGTVEIVDFGSVDQTLSAIREGATFLSLIPWFGLQLIEQGRERGVIPNRVRVVEVGGDRVPMSFHHGFKEVFGVLPREHLGMTETNVFTVNPREESEIRVGSVGLPMPEVEVEIRDQERQLLPQGEEGEIWVETPGRMKEYWGDPQKTAEAIVDGWVATGDAGFLDLDGFLWLSGRIKHIIICDGDNVHPGEVERGIAQHPLVKQVCVFGLPHELRGETVAAAVVLKNPSDTLTLDQLEGYLADRLTEVKIPKGLLILPRLPETPIGKIDRKALVQALQKGNVGG